MRGIEDQLGRKLEIPEVINRVISVVPSLTELLFDLGLEEKIVGVTKFCVHPSTARSNYPIVGGTKNLNIARLLELRPQLLIANKEENTREDIEKLQKHIPVWVSDISTISQGTVTISQLGILLDCESSAKKLVTEIDQEFRDLPQFTNLKAVYLIWQKPYMAAGADTFVSHLMFKAGFKNMLSEARYPEITLEKLQDLAPEVLLLSSEPFPFKSKHQQELQAFLPKSKVILVDGEMFSWYGSRLRYVPQYFKQLRQSEFPV